MNQSKGFTLIELMVAVMVVAILAAIAIPSYQEYMRKKDRSLAQQEMQRVATELERHRARNFSYNGFDLAKALDLPSTSGATATKMAIPLKGDKKKYEISLAVTNEEFNTTGTVGTTWVMIAIMPTDSIDNLQYSLIMKSTGYRCMIKGNNIANVADSCTSKGGETW